MNLKTNIVNQVYEYKNVFNPAIEDIELSSIIGFDSEFTSLDTLTANCVAISISNPETRINYALDTNSNIYSKANIQKLISKIQQCDIVLAHNAKVDIAILYSNFGILCRNFWCTMMASQLIDNGYGFVVKKENIMDLELKACPDRIYYTQNMVGNVPMMPSPHGLHGCIRRYLGINLKENFNKKQLQKSFINFPEGKNVSKEQLDYACADVQYLYDLYKAEMYYIEQRNQHIQVKLENKLTPVIVKMEFKGSLIDIEAHKQNIINWKAKLIEIEQQLDNIILKLGETNPYLRGGIYSNPRKKEEVIQTSLFSGMEKVVANENIYNVNYSSSKQLEDIFNRCNQPFPVDEAGKISFGEESIKLHITNYPDSCLKHFLELILDYREYSKLLSTYGENLLQLVDKNNRMRTNYTQCFTDTGRLTSSAITKDVLGLNLANLPKRSDVRKIFIPDPGYSFVDSDMTGQELILVAGYSGEETLLKAFKEGFDHHSYFASISYSIIFGRPIEIKNKSEIINIDGFEYDVKKLRDVHKSAIFCKVYLGGAKRVQVILNEYLVNHIPADKRFETAEKISKALDAAMPNMIKYLKGKVDSVKKLGYVETTLYNRRRYFDEPEKAYGDSANFDEMYVEVKLDKLLGYPQRAISSQVPV